MFARHGGDHHVEMVYQFSLDAADGRKKARRAVDEEVDAIFVIGGDGMVNTIGSEIVGTSVALGVIPAGSGNGFARHFDIPLNPSRSVQAILGGEIRTIDVGMANGRAFFVTCSMAWDAALVRSFEKFPVRGVFPYIFAAAQEFVAYRPQPFDVLFDDDEMMSFPSPLIFTAANLTQYGGGARIAPRASPDDGWLELVAVSKRDAPRLVASLNRLFDGTFDRLPGVFSRQFRRMQVRRTKPAPIQVDGELIESPREVEITLLPKSLNVLVPKTVEAKRPRKLW